MSSNVEHAIHDLPELRNRAQVFRDRVHAGDVLAGMLSAFRGSGALVLGIPAGGVPVAATVATTLGLELDVAVVSKILLPWTTEAGYGAVAFDGSTWVDARAVARFGLSDTEVLEGTGRARAKVARRVARLRGGLPLDVDGRTVILIDDGIAAGSTLRAAIAALRGQNVARLVVAVPTGHGRSLGDLFDDVDALYCANVRHGFSFAVADAYQAWRDVAEDEVVEALRTAQARAAAGRSGDAR
jgi:predicted phosphoribosyltransferase